MVTADHEVAATPSAGGSIAGSPGALAWEAAGISSDSRALDRPAARHRAAAGLPAGTTGLAGIATRIVARIAAVIADELRIRRDMRQLLAMDDYMLKDIGVTRADIGIAVRYGRD